MNNWPIITKTCIDNVESVLESGILTSKNKLYNQAQSYQTKFTDDFCKFLNIQYGKVVPNGTIALVVALLAAGVKYKDYVLVSENTWIASICAITLINAIPVLIPCEKENLLINRDKLIKLMKHYKPKACIIVHLNGFLQDYKECFGILRENKVKIIEDCAQAIGSEYKGQKAGTFGDIGVFSFQESKVLTCGEGGFICTSDTAIHRNICLYQDLTYVQKIPMKNNKLYLFGSNYRVTEQTCALLYSQFKNVFIPSIVKKDFWGKEIINLLNSRSFVRSVKINKYQNILSLFKIPVIFQNFEEKEKFRLYLEENNLNYYDGVKPLYMTDIFSEGTKDIKKMKYKKQFFDDYDVQINQVGIFHYCFNEKVFNLLFEYFKDK